MIGQRWAAALLIGVAGCNTTPPHTNPADAWTTGRLSLQVEASARRPAQSLSAAFELRGSATAGELRMLSPLGTLLVAASWQADQATLSTTEGQRRFDSLEQLSEQALGEALPLAALPDWLAGKPWSQAVHQLQAQGFEQLGWQVQTHRFSEGWISAQRASPPRVSLRVKLDRAEAL